MFTSAKDLISYIEGLKRPEKKETLQYMNELVAFFGNPHKKLKFIHIGGTNGKGSTVTYVKSILLAAGYHVGTYISPYVVCFNERITFDDCYISDDSIVAIGNEIISRFGQMEANGLRHPSFFEFVTLLALLYFSSLETIDFVVFEVGIGGKLDCTNIIFPLVSAVTNVTYDHMNILGNTLDEIWDNKLGIVKENTPFVTINDLEFVPKIKAVCQSKNAPLTLIDKKEVRQISIGLEGTQFDYKQLKKISLNLLGAHQIENAMMAIEIIWILSKDYDINEEHIKKGLKQAFWPGRLEKVNADPLILIDGAHNIDGIKRLTEFIHTTKNNRYVRIIFAVSANKEKEKMIPLLEAEADEMIFTHFEYKRSDESGHLYDLSTHPNKKIIDDLEEIIHLTKKSFAGVTVFCGSLFFISEIRNKFLKK